jgi:hypothetical protein
MQEIILKCEGGFWNHQEDIFHTGLKHKSYFVGKLNGNFCRKQMEKAKEWFVSSSAITVYSKANMSNCQTYLQPNKIDMETLHIEASPDGIGHRLLWKLKNKNETQEYAGELSDRFHCESTWNLTYLKSVTEFNDLYVGDLEYVCTLIGMNNCAGSS